MRVAMVPARGWSEWRHPAHALVRWLTWYAVRCCRQELMSYTEFMDALKTASEE